MRKARQVRVTEEMQDDFFLLCEKYAKKNSQGKYDVSSGGISVDKTQGELRQELIDLGHDLPEEITKDDQKVCPAMNSLVNSLRTKFHRVLTTGLKTKLFSTKEIDYEGQKKIVFRNDLINIGGWATFVMKNFKPDLEHGQLWVPTQLDASERQEAYDLFCEEHLTLSNSVKFKGGQRGRRAEVDEDLLAEVDF